jgi:hypothetical protein
MPHCEAPIPANSEPLPREGLRVYRREVSVQGLPTRTPARAAACSCVPMVSATASAGISVSSSSSRRVSAICGLHTPYFFRGMTPRPCALENLSPLKRVRVIPPDNDGSLVNRRDSRSARRAASPIFASQAASRHWTTTRIVSTSMENLFYIVFGVSWVALLVTAFVGKRRSV